MSIQVLTTVNPGGWTNGSNITFYSTVVTPSLPAQRVTVAQYPATNPNFTRAVQLTGEYVFFKRGSTTVGIPLTDLGAMAVTEAPSLSYSPLITLQPESTSVVAGGGNTANFTTTANSESTLAYQWAVNNGSGYVTNISNTSNNGGGQYAVIAGTLLQITPTSNTPNSYLVLCRIYNATGDTNTSAATLTVT